jgi:hypothetical protein
MAIEEGPFKAAAEAATDGVIKQELVTYRIKDGNLRKETSHRYFTDKNDYHDTTSVEILTEVK